MKATKGIRFGYKTSRELATLFEEFRLMCNDAIRMALQYEREHDGEKVASRFVLQELVYHRLKEYGLQTHYILSACEVAFSAYRNKNRRLDPYVRRAFLKLDNQSYMLNHLILRIPIRPKEFVYLTLQASDYHLSFIDDPNLKRGSITITTGGVIITFSKESALIEPIGNVGLDVNEGNITWCDSSGLTGREDTSQVGELKARYKEARASIALRAQRDRRTQRRLLAKYGKRERDRTVQIVHRVSRKIVAHAKKNSFGIVMERLSGIRRLYRRGNGQGTNYRGRMNSWTFREFQRQVEYKAAWLGVPVTYVSPRFTSRKCPNCGSLLTELEGRRLACPSCKKTGDRDVIASKNIMAASLVRAVRLPR